jgi:hypothetical protein
MIQPAFEILNQRGTPMFFSDVFANRPTAGIVGRIFISTDTKELYRDTGTTWELLAGPGSGTITGSGAAGQVSYFTGTNTIAGNNNLFWDAANSRLGIKSSSPLSNLEIKTTNDLGLVRIYNNDDASSPLHLLRGSNGVVSTNTFTSNGTITSPTDVSASGGIMRITGNIYLDGAYRGVARMEYFTTSIPTIGNPPTGIRWLTTDNSYILNERAGITSNGNLQIGDSIVNNRSSRLFVQSSGNTAATWTARFHNNTGSSNSLVIDDAGSVMLGTATSTGQRLQVNGDTLLRGTGNTSATNALIIQNSVGTTYMFARNDGRLVLGSSSTASRLELFQNQISSLSGSTITNMSIVAENITAQFSTITLGSTSPNISFAFSHSSSGITTNFNSFGTLSTFNPTSGTATFNGLLIQPVINQTGGASGITRGLYVNPSLTAAADWRSIEWSNNSGWGLYGIGTAANTFAGKTIIGSTNITGIGLLQVTNSSGDNHLRIWGSTAPSLRIDNAVSAATQRFVLGLSTATNNFIQGSTSGDICIATASANPLLFGMWQTTSATEVQRISTALNVLIGSVTDTGEKFQLTGSIRVNGQTSGTAGGSSGQHLIVNCDGTIYKIALLNA